jgi:hypothetical protein|uniref:Uncharacterized protein n=1 Tax=Eutreptiella gymnastica TaxID=73025 RepID=A0A7S4G6C0_9EUGL
MSVKDFVSKHSTPDKAILSDNDTLQLACFFDLSEQEFIVQEYQHLSAGFDLKDGFSIRPFSIDVAKSSEQARALFPGEKTEALWVCLYGDIEKSTKGITRLSEFWGKSWTVHVLVLDAEKRQLLEQRRELAKQFRLNPSPVMVTDRVVVTIGMQTPWFAWYLRFTPQSIWSVKPPVMRTKKLFQCGVKPSAELFTEPGLLDNIFSYRPTRLGFRSFINVSRLTTPTVTKSLGVTHRTRSMCSHNCLKTKYSQSSTSLEERSDSPYKRFHGTKGTLTIFLRSWSFG